VFSKVSLVEITLAASVLAAPSVAAVVLVLAVLLALPLALELVLEHAQSVTINAAKHKATSDTFAILIFEF
jgi:hypothetical protein